MNNKFNISFSLIIATIFTVFITSCERELHNQKATDKGDFNLSIEDRSSNSTNLILQALTYEYIQVINTNNIELEEILSAIENDDFDQFESFFNTERLNILEDAYLEVDELPSELEDYYISLDLDNYDKYLGCKNWYAFAMCYHHIKEWYKENCLMGITDPLCFDINLSAVFMSCFVNHCFGPGVATF